MWILSRITPDDDGEGTIGIMVVVFKLIAAIYWAMQAYHALLTYGWDHTSAGRLGLIAVPILAAIAGYTLTVWLIIIGIVLACLAFVIGVLYLTASWVLGMPDGIDMQAIRHLL